MQLSLFPKYYAMKNLPLFLTFCLLISAPLLAQPQPSEKNQLDAQGRKQGYWVKLSGDTLKYDGTFQDDVPVGQFRYYYPDKTIKSVVQYSEKGLMAKAVNYSPKGKKMAEGEYWDKKKHGLWKYYNDEEKLIKIEDYHSGIPEGEWINYFPDGKPISIKHYERGVLNGPFCEFFADSLINFKGTYKNGLTDGLVTYYYLSGKVMVSGNYKAEVKDGLWMYFNEIGQADKRMTYADGRLISEEITTPGPDQKIIYLNIENIAYVFNQGGLVKIRMSDGTDYVSDRKLDEFAHILNEYKFFRVNANYFVSLSCISNRKEYSPEYRILRLTPATAGEVIVSDANAEGFLHWAGLVRGEVDPKTYQE